MGDEFGKKNERIGDDDQGVNDACGGDGELSPVAGTDGLWNNLRKYENQEGQYGRGEGEELIAPDFLALRSDSCSTHRVCDGVEGKDGRNRFVNVLFVFFQQRGARSSFTFQHGNESHGSGKQNGFKN